MNQNSRGYLIALASALSYGVMSFLVHWNPMGFPPMELVCARSVVMAVLLFPYVWRETGKFFRKDAKILWIRSATGAVGIVCYFTALQGTSSSNANLLYSTSPMFVALFAWLFFRTKVVKAELAGIFLILLGNAILWIPQQSPIPMHVGLIGTGGALFASLAFLSISEAVKRYSAELTVFGFSMFSLIVAIVFPSAPWKPVSHGILYLLVIGILGLTSQWSSTLSFRYLKSSIASAIGRGSILFSGILDILYSSFRPGIFELISYVLIFLGIYIAHRYRHHFLIETNI